MQLPDNSWSVGCVCVSAYILAWLRWTEDFDPQWMHTCVHKLSYPPLCCDMDGNGDEEFQLSSLFLHPVVYIPLPPFRQMSRIHFISLVPISIALMTTALSLTVTKLCQWQWQ